MTYMEYVSSGIILVGPSKAVEDLEDVIVLEDAEEAIEEDLETDGCRLAPVQHQTGDVEHDVGLDDLHLHGTGAIRTPGLWLLG